MVGVRKLMKFQFSEINDYYLFIYLIVANMNLTNGFLFFIFRNVLIIIFSLYLGYQHVGCKL